MCLVCRLTTTTEHVQRNVPLLFIKRIQQLAVALTYVNREPISLLTTLFEFIEEDTPLLPGGAEPFTLFFGKPIQQILLRIKANGATVIVTGGCLLVAINDVQ